MATKIVRSPWLMLGATGVLFLVVALGVDLRPVVDENFFFAASDPAFRQAKKIEGDLVIEASEELILLQLSPVALETATNSPAA